MISTGNPATVEPTSGGITFDWSSARFGELRESSDALADVAELRRRMDADGYVFLRGFLNPEAVLDARLEVNRRLAQLGFLDPTAPLSEGRGITVEQARLRHEKDGLDSERYESRTDFMADELAKDNAPLDAILYGPEMMGFFDRFFGEPAKHFDFTWFRSIFPGADGTRPHTDVIFMGRAERQQLYTVWTPIGDVDLAQGGLIVLEGSHKHPGLRAGFSSQDVDSYCVNKPWVHDWFTADRESGGRDGSIAPDVHAVQEVIGGRWLTTEFDAGDVLIFSVFTVHGSLDNQSDKVRISSDSRYQPGSKPADERWVGSDPVGHGPRGKRGLIC